MKFYFSSPDTLLFDRNEFSKNMSRNHQIGLSMVALFALGLIIGLIIKMCGLV